MNAAQSCELSLIVSPLPWRIKYYSTPERDRAVIVDAHGRKVTDFWSSEKERRILIEGNSRLIVEAMNACYAVKPDEPFAAAQSYPLLVNVLRRVVNGAWQYDEEIKDGEPVYHISTRALEAVKAVLTFATGREAHDDR